MHDHAWARQRPWSSVTPSGGGIMGCVFGSSPTSQALILAGIPEAAQRRRDSGTVSGTGNRQRDRERNA